MTILKKNLKLIFFLSFLFLFFSISLAQPCPYCCPEECPGGIMPCGRDCDDPNTAVVESSPCSFCHILILAKRIIDFFFKKLALPILSLMLVIAGFLFIIAGGVEERIRRARNALKAAIIGLVVSSIGWVFINLLVAFGTGETEEGIGKIFGKKWNEISCEVTTTRQPTCCGDKVVQIPNDLGFKEECEPEQDKNSFINQFSGNSKYDFDRDGDVDEMDWRIMKCRCRFDCTLSDFDYGKCCGDGIVEVGYEECDPNQTKNDFLAQFGGTPGTPGYDFNLDGKVDEKDYDILKCRCTKDCTLEGYLSSKCCGDGVVDPLHEECDPNETWQDFKKRALSSSNPSLYDYNSNGTIDKDDWKIMQCQCTDLCKMGGYNVSKCCGDGILEVGEECDPGISLSDFLAKGIDLNNDGIVDENDYNAMLCRCSSQCTLGEYDYSKCCPDGKVVKGFEQCDPNETELAFLARCSQWLLLGSPYKDYVDLNKDNNCTSDDYFMLKALCSSTNQCQIACLGDPLFDQVGEGCYLDPDGSLQNNPCQKGKYVCIEDPNNPGHYSIQCVDVFSQKVTGYENDYIGKPLFDYCCKAFEPQSYPGYTFTQAQQDLNNLGVSRYKPPPASSPSATECTSPTNCPPTSCPEGATWCTSCTALYPSSPPPGSDCLISCPPGSEGWCYTCDEYCRSKGKICVGVAITDSPDTYCYAVKCHTGEDCTLSANTQRQDCRSVYPFYLDPDACTIPERYRVGYTSCLCK